MASTSGLVCKDFDPFTFIILRDILVCAEFEGAGIELWQGLLISSTTYSRTESSTGKLGFFEHPSCLYFLKSAAWSLGYKAMPIE